MGEGRVLLVGESNPYGPDSHFALWPDPPGCAGHRLCYFVLRMGRDEYLRTFRRCNLIQGRGWSLPAARRAAGQLFAHYRVLLGARVAAAHDVEFHPFTAFADHRDDCEYDCPRPGSRCMTYVILPHPSGRSRLWNDPQAGERARRLVLGLVAEAARG